MDRTRRRISTFAALVLVCALTPLLQTPPAGASTPLTKVFPADGATSDEFGSSVATSGSTAIIGAPLDDSGASDAGSAYVYVRSAGGSWTLQQQLVPGDGVASGRFGAAVAIEGDTAVVGAPGDDDLGWGSGAVYVFTRSGTTWSLQQKILAAGGTWWDSFGRDVDLSGDALVAGSSSDDLAQDAGAAYVFTRSGTTWTQQQQLLAADGAALDDVGASVAIDADTVVAGAPGDDDAGAEAGAAYVFTRSGTVWSEQQKVLAADGAAGDRLGGSVDVRGDRAAAGAHLDDHSGRADAGSAYVYERAAGVWSQTATLRPAAPDVSDWFGHDVAVDDTTVTVGAPKDDDMGTDAGKASTFQASGGFWPLVETHRTTGTSGGDRLGWAVAADWPLVVLGAPLDSPRGTASGSMHGVQISATPSLGPLTSIVVDVGTAIPAVPLSIVDGDHPLDALTLSATSTNDALVPDAGITFALVDGTWTMSVEPVAGASGTAFITVVVTDPTFKQAGRALGIAIYAEPMALAVDTTIDLTDADPGDRVCGTGAPGSCSLRAAVQETNANVTDPADVPDSITVPAGVHLLTIAGVDDTSAAGDLDVVDTVTISGVDGAVVDAAGVDDAVLDVFADLSVSGLVITGSSGAGITADDVLLSLEDVEVHSNAGPGLDITDSVHYEESIEIVDSQIHDNGGIGIDIDTSAYVAITRTTVAGNGGSGIEIFGALASLDVTDATISGNVATGVSISGVEGGLRMTGSTISGNGSGGITASDSYIVGISGSTITANTGGGLNLGVYNLSGSGNIIANQTSGPDCSGTVVFGLSLGGLDSDGTCHTGYSRNPRLGPLQDNGGPTLTHAPEVGSPAIDAGALPGSQCGGTDQRGVARPQGPRCDFGAVEAPVPFVVTTTVDAPDVAPGDGLCGASGGACTLRAAVMEANARPALDRITLAPGATYPLTIVGAEDAAAQGDLDVTDSLQLAGNGATVDGSALGDRVWQVLAGRVEMADLTIRGGTAPGSAAAPGNIGGGIASWSDLRLTRVLVEGSTAAIGGGIASTGHLELLDSEVRDNAADVVGGGIASAGTLVVTRSTIADNSADIAGALFSSGLMDVLASTVSGNAASVAGIVVNMDEATVRSSTIAGNTAPVGAGVASFRGTGPSSITIESSTLVVNGPAGASPALAAILSGDADDAITVTSSIIAAAPGRSCFALGPPVTSGGHNLDADGTCALGDPTDLSNVDPLLGPLRDNGGPTATMAPTLESPAVNSGSTTCAAVDQRGWPRPFARICDRGAVEIEHPAISTAWSGRSQVVSGRWFASADLTASTGLDVPAPATVIDAEYRIKRLNSTFTAWTAISCTAAADGTCVLRVPPAASSTGMACTGLSQTLSVEYRITDVSGDLLWDGYLAPAILKVPTPC